MPCLVAHARDKLRRCTLRWRTTAQASDQADVEIGNGMKLILLMKASQSNGTPWIQAPPDILFSGYL